MDTLFIGSFSPDSCLGGVPCSVVRSLKGEQLHEFYSYIDNEIAVVTPRSFDWTIIGGPGGGGGRQYWGPDWDYDIWKMLDSAGCPAAPYLRGRSESIRIDSVIRGFFPYDAVAYAQSPSLGDFILLIPLSTTCKGTIIDRKWDATLWSVKYIISRENAFGPYFYVDTVTVDNLVQYVPGSRFIQDGATIIRPDQPVFRDSCLCTDSVVIRRQCRGQFEDDNVR